jgi:hypothetical protein
MGIKVDAVAVGMSDARLQSAKKATPTGDSQDHAAEFAKDLLPGLKRNTFTTMQFIKNSTQAGITMRREFERLGDSVNEPAKEKFSSTPTTVAFEQFLNRDRFLMKSVGRVQRSNDFVDGMKQDTMCNTPTTSIALDQVTKIVDIHIGVCQRECMRLAAG